MNLRSRLLHIKRKYMMPINYIHIFKSGPNSPHTICAVKLNSSIKVYYNWDNPLMRFIIRKNSLPNATIKVDDNVTKGWNYGKRNSN